MHIVHNGFLWCAFRYDVCEVLYYSFCARCSLHRICFSVLVLVSIIFIKFISNPFLKIISVVWLNYFNDNNNNNSNNNEWYKISKYVRLICCVHGLMSTYEEVFCRNCILHENAFSILLQYADYMWQFSVLIAWCVFSQLWNVMENTSWPWYFCSDLSLQLCICAIVPAVCFVIFKCVCGISRRLALCKLAATHRMHG